MSERIGQVIGVVLIVALNASAQEARQDYAAQLQNECRQLIMAGIEKPYGLAWGIAPAASGSAPRPVVMEPLHSPAAGVLLLWSGQLLKDQALIDAAKKAAAGVMAAQAESGQIAPMALFGDSAEPRPAGQVLLDRASTRAGLALLLAVAETQLNRDPKLLESIDKASRWLRKTAHGNSGLWQRTDPGFEGGTEQFVRLDDSDFRDNTFALLLEFEVTSNPDARAAVDRLLNAVFSMQLNEINEFLPGGKLWGRAYRLNHQSVEFDGTPAKHADLLACRYMVQTELGSIICWGNKSRVTSLSDAAERINRIKGDDGKWIRYAGMDTPGASSPRGDFGLPPVLSSIKSLKSLGPDRYKQLMSQGMNPKQQLASCVVGLNDQPFTLDWPVAAREVPDYIQKRSAAWRLIEGDAPDALRDRVARLWVLYERAKLEAM